MAGPSGWLRSTVGKKVLMAGSGLLLFGFVFAHMAGNLKAFQGAAKFNEYAEFIRTLGEPVLPHSGFLWVQRVFLLGVVVMHGVIAVQLARLSKRARPQRYKKSPDLGFSYASRTMRWGGVIIAVFVVYHLLHLTVGTVHADFVAHNPYQNLVTGLSNPLVALVYAVAVTALSLHLYHGLWSSTQTFGLAQGSLDSLRRPLVTLLVGAVWLGYLIVPAAILIGWIRP